MEMSKGRRAMTRLGKFEAWLESSQPVIVIGMHRSGTTLLVRLLMEMGIYMGRKLLKNAESLYFQRLNREMFSSAGARWSVVDPLLRAMENSEFTSEQTENLKRRLTEPRRFFQRRPARNLEQAGLRYRHVVGRFARRGGRLVRR